MLVKSEGTLADDLLKLWSMRLIVTSKLDFFNSVLYRLAGYPIERVQKVQNAAARIVTLMPRRSVSRLYYTVYTGCQLNIG